MAPVRCPWFVTVAAFCIRDVDEKKNVGLNPGPPNSLNNLDI